MATDDPLPTAADDAHRPVPERPTPAPKHAAGAPAEPKKRPDPRPMRLALGAGTLAAVSIMTAGLVRYPVPAADAGDAVAADAPTTEVVATARPEIRIKHRTVYVQLKRGQQAPKGAKVIEGKAPPPRVVVTRIKAKPATTRQTRVRRVTVTRTRQSGR